MDRNRLKEVRQSDLTESRINEDFLTWLKTSGPTYLLIVLVLLCAYVLWVRWKEHKQTYVATAWAEYNNSDLPSSLIDVAVKYPDVGALAGVARLDAAERWMRAVQLNQSLAGAEGQTPIPLTDEERAQYLDGADRVYAEVVADDDGAPGRTLVVVNALFGRAAVAEAKDDVEAARGFYEQAAARAEAVFPNLAAQARRRMESVATAIAAVTLPVDSPDSAPAELANQRTPLIINPALAGAIAPGPGSNDDS